MKTFRSVLVVSCLAILAACVGEDPAVTSPPSGTSSSGDGGSAPPGTPPGGGNASLAIAPASLSFPITAPTKSSSAMKVTITNKGTAPSVALEVPAITGPQGSSFGIANDGCGGKVLAIAAECSIDVVFKPEGPGPAVGTLAVGSLTSSLAGTSSFFLPEDAEHAAQNSLNAIYAVDASHVYAVGQNGRVVVSNDGATWTAVATPAGSTELRAVYPSADGYLYVGGKGPFLMVQPPTSSGFTQVTLPTTQPITQIHALWATPSGAQQKQVYALGEGGRWLSFDQNTTPSMTLPTAVGTAIYAVAGHHNPSGSGDQYFIAAGANATVQEYFSSNGPNLMSHDMPPTTRTFQAAWTDGVNVVVAANDGAILRGTGGASLAVEATLGLSFTGLWGPSNTDLWAVGSGGAIYHSVSPGSWTKIESGTTKDLRGIHGTSSTNLYVVGDGVILHKKL